MKIKISKKECFIFIGFGLLLFMIPYLFTRPWGIFPVADVGGTVGGVTAPFLGFFGSILVYLALKAQVDANNLVQEQFEVQREESRKNDRMGLFNYKMKTIKKEIDNFTYLYTNLEYKGGPRHIQYKGSQAVYYLLKNSKDSYFGKVERTPYQLEPKLLELKSLLVFLRLTIQEIMTEDLIDDPNKKELFKIIEFIFESKLRGNFDAMKDFTSTHDEKCPHNCGNYHGIPSELFDIYYSIELKIKMVTLSPQPS